MESVGFADQLRAVPPSRNLYPFLRALFFLRWSVRPLVGPTVVDALINVDEITMIWNEKKTSALKRSKEEEGARRKEQGGRGEEEGARRKGRGGGRSETDED